MMSTFSLLRATGMLGAMMLAAGNAGAVIITFNTNSSCFATVPTGTTCLATDTQRVFTDGLGDTATLSWSSFTGVADSSNSQVVNIGYGTMQWTYTGSSTAHIAFTPFNFALIITETSPVAQTFDTFVGTVSGPSGGNGQIGMNFSNAQISFTPQFSTRGSVVFDTFPPIQLLVDPSTNNGKTTIQGQVLDMGVPEPGSTLLMGAGLLGLGWLSRKKLAL